VIARLAVVALALLAGCASPQMPYQADKMTPEQLKAMAADKSADATCSKVVAPWGHGTVVAVKLDKGSTPASGVSVEIGADCVTRIVPTAEPAKPTKP